jgi:hypothetical protein
MSSTRIIISAASAAEIKTCNLDLNDSVMPRDFMSCIKRRREARGREGGGEGGSEEGEEGERGEACGGVKRK